MNFRELGKTGISVSEVGFGAWGIGGKTEGATSYGETDDAVSLETLKVAFDEGVNFYDTSNVYGDGHSEELLGEAFGSNRGEVAIASKVGYLKHHAPQDFSKGNIRKSLEGTLRRLKTECLDLYQLHDPPIEVLDSNSEILETLEALKSEGKIRAYGVSVRSPEDGVVAIRKFGAPVIQVNFNLTDHRAINSGLLDLAVKEKVGIIARTPLSFGFLAGTLDDRKFEESDHRSSWPDEQIRIWKESPRLFEEMNEGKERTLAQFALKFCLSFPAVSTVIPGMLKPEHALENAAASDFGPLSPEELEKILEIAAEKEFFIGKG